MKHTRRQFLLRAGTLAVGLAAGCGSTEQGATAGGGSLPGPGPVPPAPAPAFLQPAVRVARDGLLDTTLEVKLGTNLVNGQRFTSRTYEGALAGPTLRIKPGDTLRFRILNRLPENEDEDVVYVDMNTPHEYNTTNNHVHGVHVSPSGNSDNIFVEVVPGDDFLYEYQIPANHPAGTYWYHPHRHGSVSEQLLGGMAGALLIEGDIDAVPEVAAARDLVFLVNELSIDPETGMVPEFLPSPDGIEFEIEERTLTVNGQVNPTLTTRPGEVVRLRIINAAVQTQLPIEVESHDLLVLAYDGITLAQAESTQTVDLTPGGRADVLLRAGAPGTYRIKKLLNSATLDDDPEETLATLVVVGSPVSMALPTTLPAPLHDIESSELTGQRTLVFSLGPDGPPGPPPPFPPPFLNFPIDNRRFDKDRVDHTVQLGAVEEWTLINLSSVGHPFHIHVNPFQVISINGRPLPRPEWRDTVLIPAADLSTGPGTVVIRQRFEDFKGMFVLHCHILTHEDLGMMQIVNVV